VTAPRKLVVHVDGGARGNPGPAAAASVVSAPDGTVLDEAHELLGETTNNVAEYRAVLLGVARAVELGAGAVELVNDAELIAKQLTGEYAVRDARLAELHGRAVAALARLDAWTIRSVPRAENARADALVNAALDGGAGRAVPEDPGVPDWMRWVRRLQAEAQAGLHYATGEFDELRFQSVADVAAEMMAAGTGVPVDPVARGFAAEAGGHPTPKVDVRGILVRDGQVLLVQERSDGRWTLPGGWADPGEAPGETVEREVLEESGYAVRAVKLAFVHDRDRHNRPPLPASVYKLFFVCALEQEAPVEDHDHEIDAVAWFDPADPPPLSEGRVTPAQLLLAAAHAADLERPTEFD
jgi:ADP-ribose pyrophosphatase YjhB (NUDIX family)/ribonuclease HI